MNILILQGSPRANGNTAWMAEEYKKAAEAAGHQVTLVNVSKKKIAGCLACEYCHQRIELLHVVFLNAGTIALVMAVLASQTACNLIL